MSRLSASDAKVLREKLDIDMGASASSDGVGNQFEIIRKRIQQAEEKAMKKINGNGPDDCPGVV